MVGLQKFLDSPSVDIPGEGELAKKKKKKNVVPQPAVQLANLLNTQVATVNASSEDSENNSMFGKREFCRVVEIPESCEKRKVRAKLDKGILHLVLPKRKADKPIEVKIN